MPKLGCVEADLSVGYSHTLSSGRALRMKTNVDGRGWTSVEELGDMNQTRRISWDSNECE